MQLFDAFGLAAGDIAAIVGGGGKTTLMYRLARDVAATGGHAVACGTTLFTPPPAAGGGLPIIVDRDADRLLARIAVIARGDGAVIAATGRGTKGRLLPVDPEMPARMLAAGIANVFVEADGSRGRPLKAPAGHEPVIPAGATVVIAVAGMRALGAPLDDAHVHRPERIIALTGAAAGTPVTPRIIAAVLAHPEGGRKGVHASTRFAVMLNQVAPALLDDARRIAALLRDRGVERIVLARTRDDAPVVDVIR